MKSRLLKQNLKVVNWFTLLDLNIGSESTTLMALNRNYHL